VDFSCIADIPRIQVHEIHKIVHQFKSIDNNTLQYIHFFSGHLFRRKTDTPSLY
jgi:hypothetical protein